MLQDCLIRVSLCLRQNKFCNPHSKQDQLYSPSHWSYNVIRKSCNKFQGIYIYVLYNVVFFLAYICLNLLNKLWFACVNVTRCLLLYCAFWQTCIRCLVSWVVVHSALLVLELWSLFIFLTEEAVSACHKLFGHNMSTSHIFIANGLCWKGFACWNIKICLL